MSDAREHDVKTCGEECGACKLTKDHPSLPWEWGARGARRINYCPVCGTRVGIDKDGPWRQAMVPASDADRLRRGLSAMAFRAVEEGCRAAQDFTGDPILTGTDAAEPAARIMREVMAAIDAGPQEDGGLLEVPDAVPMAPRAALEWLAAQWAKGRKFEGQDDGPNCPLDPTVDLPSRTSCPYAPEAWHQPCQALEGKMSVRECCVNAALAATEADPDE